MLGLHFPDSFAVGSGHGTICQPIAVSRSDVGRFLILTLKGWKLPFTAFLPPSGKGMVVWGHEDKVNILVEVKK
jgi:hypothetical protein